jgi:hypothetical protein
MLAAILVRRKLLLALFVPLAVLALYFALFAPPPARLDPAVGQDAVAARGLTPPANDAAVYATLEQYVHALVADDRPAVLQLLTVEHRGAFGEASFLLLPGVREEFSEIRLASLNHSFPTYTAQLPGMAGVMVAVLEAEYTAHFVRDGQVVHAPRFREELVLREQEGRWLIAVSRRDFLAQDGQDGNE